jgi:hypothetical protein
MQKIIRKTEVETSLDSLGTLPILLGVWISKEDDSDDGEFVEISGNNMKEMASKLQCSELLIDSLQMLVASINEAFKSVNQDLKELGEKII